MADMPSGTILCPHGPRSWRAAAFTHPLGSVFHGHSRTTVMCMVGGVLHALPQSEDARVPRLAVSEGLSLL